MKSFRSLIGTCNVVIFVRDFVFIIEKKNKTFLNSSNVENIHKTVFCLFLNLGGNAKIGSFNVDNFLICGVLLEQTNANSYF